MDHERVIPIYTFSLKYEMPQLISWLTKFGTRDASFDYLTRDR